MINGEILSDVQVVIMVDVKECMGDSTQPKPGGDTDITGDSCAPIFLVQFQGASARTQPSSFLHDVLRKIRAATHDFTEAPLADNDYDGELAGSLLTALLVLQSVQLPGVVQHMCLMCTSPIIESTPWRQNLTRESMERRYLFSCGYWTLQEISILPSWREDMDSPPRLCTFYGSVFILALEAVLVFVDPPARIRLERRHSF